MINKSSKLSNEKGQLTIFMGIAITIIFSCLAFMVNVGLFVKAKINLQNAVDAAAWSGAAVQARQLSKIGYLNWEIRNVYKEWMFKYYVVGQLANSKIASDTKTPKDFRPKVLSSGSGFVYDKEAFSRFNAPSICIHFDNDSFNICAVAGSPGLPRFGDLGIAGVAESQKAFVNDMVANKANDCSRRTDLNFGTAMIWAYGAGGTESGMQSDAPKIAADRMGAWPKSLEIALRMRNLEYIVNRPPVDQPICMGGSDCKTVQALASDASGTPLNERPVKAFMSAYRNLSGGYNGESQDKFQDLKNSFKLTEIAPQPLSLSGATDTLSTYFIPDIVYPGSNGVTAKEKSYLDLQLQMINYITFYTAFVASGGSYGDGEIASEGACANSVVGLPVPGYIMGYTKNPNVLTYYAVKGEAKFTGLFYPFFSESDGITLTAYAAAKPFGGRIGPKFFKSTNDPAKGLTFRDKRSYAYAMGMKTGFSSGDPYRPGFPIPFYQDFYIQDAGDNAGGVPESGEEPKFAIPNLIYNYISGDMSNHDSANISIIEKISGEANQSDAKSGAELKVDSAGMYSDEQFKEFSSVLPGASSIDANTLNEAIIKVKKPTAYDSLNYMIPTHHTGSDIESPTIITSTPDPNYANVFNWSMYAPLIDDQFLYKNEQEIEVVVQNFVESNELAYASFIFALSEVAKSMKIEAIEGSNSDLATSASAYDQAADALFKGVTCSSSSSCSSTCNSLSGGCLKLHNNLGDGSNADCQASSLSQKFSYFFDSSNGTKSPVCGIVPIHFNVAKAYTDAGSIDPSYFQYYRAQYHKPSSIKAKDLMTAYMPGVRQGADEEGNLTHPFSGAKTTQAKRNSYSTKLIGIKRLISQSDSNTYLPQIGYAEGSDAGNLGSNNNKASDLSEAPALFKNNLKSSQLNEFGSELDY